MRKSWTLLLLAAAVFGRPASAQTPLKLGFGDAVKMATGQAPSVALASLSSDEARARVRQTRAALLPGVTAGAAWVNRNFNVKALGIPFPSGGPFGSFPTVVPAFNNYDARLTLNQTLVDFSSLRRVHASEAQVQSSLAAGDATTETAAQVAALAYLRAARALASVTARLADSTIAAEVLGLAEAQLAAGVSGTLDVTRAKTQVAVAAGALVVARNQYDQARIALARALGIDPTTEISLTDTLTSALGSAQVPADRDAAVAQALGARPELKVEQARGNAAELSKSAVRSELLPRVGLEADYGINGLTWPNSFGTRQVAVAVSIPLLDGFRREGREAEQDAVIQESQVRQHDLRQQIAADVAGALLDLHSAEAQEGIAAQQLTLAADELSQAEKRFKAGVAGNIEVIDAQASMVKARDAAIDARFGAAAARVALARAVGAARTLH